MERIDYRKTCVFCGEFTEGNAEECDGCWYGMRLCREAWLRELKKKGKPEPVHQGGCIRLGSVHINRNPYKVR